MFLTVDLRDNENMTVKSFKFEFHAQETLRELQDKIFSEFETTKCHLYIYDTKSRRIDLLCSSTSLENAGIRDCDKWILKHGDLGWWKMYKECVDLVFEQRSERVYNAQSAVRYHEILTKRCFFELYPQYDKFQKEKHSEVVSWTEGEDILIRKATERYFQNLHDQRSGDEESEFICYFEKPELDEELCTCCCCSHLPITLASVQIHGEESVTKYNINFHHYYGTYEGRIPDVTELYIYKLLELIGVGHKCHIIPRTIWTGTKSSTYIAIQEDEKFENLDQLWINYDLSADVVVQVSILSRLLYISNLHQQNCGKWKGTENVAILAFSPGDNFRVFDDWKFQLTYTYVDVRWFKVYNETKNQHDDNSWFKIGKVYFDKWDISSKIELAREQFDPTDTLVKFMTEDDKDPDWHDSYTQQLDEYIDILYKNVEGLRTFLNSIE